MRIGFDVSDLCTDRADGTTRYTRELAKRLPDLSDDEWGFFAPCDPPTPRESHFVTLAGESARLRWHSSPWPRYWTQSRLPLDLYRYRPDIMFMPIQQIPFVRPGKMKTVAVVHDLAFHIYPEQFTYKDWALQHIFTAYAARQADQIIAVSQATADDIAKYYGRGEDVQVVQHGVDLEKFKPADTPGESLRDTHRGVSSPYLLYVGQIQPRKNLERLVEVFERLAERDEDLQLVIAGSHGWLNGPIYQDIDQSVVRDRIKLLGGVSDEELVRLYQSAEVFVLPSLYEGFGMPILEAMACGAPVVTSNVSSMPEVAGEAAVLVDPKSVESITDGIMEAIGRKDDLREKGLARAQQFSWDRTARETLNVLARIA